jgi:hypothetical protein
MPTVSAFSTCLTENCKVKIFFQVRVVISSAVPHGHIFLTQQQEDFSDEDRKLMDDLNIQHGSVSLLYEDSNFICIYYCIIAFFIKSSEKLELG